MAHKLVLSIGVFAAVAIAGISFADIFSAAQADRNASVSAENDIDANDTDAKIRTELANEVGPSDVTDVASTATAKIPRLKPATTPNYSSPRALALSLSYPLYGSGKSLGVKSNPDAFTGGGDKDRPRVHASYKTARARAVTRTATQANVSHPRADRYWANCSAFTATVINNTVDPAFPSNLVRNQYAYITQKGSGWKKVGATANYRPQDYRAGDIFITTSSGRITSGHTFMWIGDYGGLKEVVAEASYGKEGSKTARMPALRKNVVKKKADGFGRVYEVWRFVGKPKAPGVNGTFDFNNVGKADFLTVRTTGTLHLYAGKGKGGFKAGETIGHGWSNMDVVTMADANGDGRGDIVAANKKTGVLYIYPGNGKGGFTKRAIIGKGFNTMRDLTSPGDIDGDGISDLVAIRKSDGKLVRWIFNKNGRIVKKAEIGHGWKSWTISSGSDLNNDGKADLIAKDNKSGKLYLYRGSGKGTFSSSRRLVVSGGSYARYNVMSVGNWAGSSHADLIIRDTKTGKLYRANGISGAKVGARKQIGHGFNTMPQIK